MVLTVAIQARIYKARMVPVYTLYSEVGVYSDDFLKASSEDARRAVDMKVWDFWQQEWNAETTKGAHWRGGSYPRARLG